MPVYLFSFHAYRSWMPDHRRGYTRRNRGYLPPDPEAAQKYKQRAQHEKTVFSDAVVRALLDEFIGSCPKIQCRFHAGASNETHIHGLVSWRHMRGWMSVRKSLKTSLTKQLKAQFPEIAFSRGGSRKHVRDRDHFDYLMNKYLPDHRGPAWYEDRGWVMQVGRKARRRKH